MKIFGKKKEIAPNALGDERDKGVEEEVAKAPKKSKKERVKKVKDKTQRIQKKGKEKIKDKVIKDRVSIKLKLIVSHIAIGVLPMLLVVLLILNNADKGIIEEVEQADRGATENKATILNMLSGSVVDTTKLIVTDFEVLDVVAKNEDDYENIFFFNTERMNVIDPMFMTIQLTNQHIENIVFIKENETIASSEPDYMREETFIDEFFSSDLYTAIVDNKSSVYWFYDEFEEDRIFLARQVRNMATDIGVLMFTLHTDYFADAFEFDELPEGVEVFITDEVGNVIVTNMEEKDSTGLPFFSEIEDDIILHEEEHDYPLGVFSTDTGLDSMSMISYAEMDQGWYYVKVQPLNDVRGAIVALQTISILFFIVAAGIAVVAGIFMAFSITSPINYFKTKLKQLEQGDLTVKSNIVGNNEFGQLSKSFNQMTENVGALIGEVRGTATEVHTDSQSLNAIAKQSAAASKEIMIAVESLATGANEQARDADKTTGVIRELTSRINETESTFSSVIEATTRTKEVSSQATVTIDELNKTTQEAIELSDNIKSDMKDLVERFEEILGIVKLIDGISDQTNLLALNAAIEAARAGDAGKGFAVVADEVRKLAEQSGEATKQISTIVNGIYDATTKTEKMIENSAGVYVKQEKAVQNTDETFKVIVNDMDAISHEIDKVSKLLAGLDSIQNEAIDATTSIASIAEESAAAVEQVLATGQEQSASADQLSHMSENLGEIIKHLNESIEGFKTE